MARGSYDRHEKYCCKSICCLPCLCLCGLGVATYLTARAILRESLRLPRARMAGRLASWTEDKDKEEIPELLLNRLLITEVFLQMLASGLGTIALVWATVVLLGGFSSALKRMDFWFVTAIVFVETARIVGYNSAPEAKFFVDVPAAFFSSKTLQVGSATDFVGLITMGPALVAIAPIFAASACITLSIWRLLSTARHGYHVGSNDASSNDNLLPALILFYALVLTQGALFLMWLVVAMSRSAQAEDLSDKYFTGEERKKITDKYIARTRDICVENGVLSTMNRTLVTFAEELLQSELENDHEVAVLVLQIVLQREERTDGATVQICSSEQLVCRLIRLLSSKGPNKLARKHAAEIVKHISKNLYLADLPGAANSLSSLLDDRLITTAAQTSHNTKETSVNIESSDKSLIVVNGLQILCKLADDPVNCTEICNTKDLVSKIIGSLSHGLHVAVVNKAAAVEIVNASIGVLAKLTSGTSESSTELCCYLLDNSGTVGNMLSVLRISTDMKILVLAVKILTSLTLCRRLSKERKRLVFDQVECPDIEQMVTILTGDEISNVDRAVTAQFLAQLCADSGPAQDMNRLRPIYSALSTVLKVIGSTQCTEDDGDDIWKLLGGLLNLTNKICVNLANPADTFSAAVKAIPEQDHVFVKKLKEKVDTCMDRFSVSRSSMDSEDILCLTMIMMKAAAKFATWMMKIKCHYIECFCQVNFVEKLDTSIINDMANLEKHMILTGCRDDSEGGETILQLVTCAKKLVSQQQA